MDNCVDDDRPDAVGKHVCVGCTGGPFAWLERRQAEVGHGFHRSRPAGVADCPAQHRIDVARDALEARTPEGYRTTELARELMSIARYGLGRQAEAAGHPDESVYLDRLAQLTIVGRCPADEILDWYHANQPTPRQIIEHLAV